MSMNVSANILFWFAGSSPSSRRGGTGSFFVSNGVIAGVSFIAGFGSLVFIGFAFLGWG